jgi:ankyrin repeat protein
MWAILVCGYVERKKKGCEILVFVSQDNQLAYYFVRAQHGRQTFLPSRKDLFHEPMQLLANACQLDELTRPMVSDIGFVNKVADRNTTNNEESFSPNLAMTNVLRPTEITKGFGVDSQGFRFDAPNDNGKTPLHVAAPDEKLDLAEEIVNSLKSLETRNNSSVTALLLACLR